MNKYVAVSVGDLRGIGIDLLINLWIEKKVRNFVLFTNIKIFQKYLKKRKLKFDINIVNHNNSLIIKRGCFNVYTYEINNSYDNTYKSLKLSFQYCKKRLFKGLVTLPLRKDLIIENIDKKFIGHTEFFQTLDNKKNSNMFLYHKKILISTLTTHIKINSVTKLIKKKDFVYNQIKSLNNSLIKDFNITKPKLTISGVNPHAGENGYIGEEEKNLLKPIIQKLRKHKIDITGPKPADSMLLDKKIKYDCYIFIYHDQALIPFKLISKFSGVNYTGNLDIVRTSPDHGTAYNLKRKKNFSYKSLVNCFKLINLIYANRKKYKNSQKIFKSKFS